MNRSTDTRNSSGKLPSFLGDDGDEAALASPLNVATDNVPEDSEDYEEPNSQDLSTADDDDGDYQDEDYEDDSDQDDAPEDTLDDGEENAGRPEFSAARSTIQRNSRRRHQAAPAGLGGGMTLAVGALTTIAGLVIGALPVAATALAGVIAPQTIILLGLFLLALATSQRRAAKVQQRLLELEAQRHAVDDELRDTLAQLLQGQSGQQADTNDGDRADVQHVMLSLQRQDQKINNLTKAIKMYGKPLMEIAGQGTELAGSLAQVKALIEGAAESTRQAVNRVEQAVRNGSGKSDLGDLPEQVGKLQVTLLAISQRLEDSEVRKSLLRVEDATTQLRTQVETLQSGSHIKAATSELQLSLDKATASLSTGIEQLRNGNLNGLETSVREIQRDISGLATGMTQLQAAVKNSARAATNAAPSNAATSNPTTSSPATSSPAAATPSPSSANKTSAPAAATASACSPDAKDDSGYSTGKRKTTGQNVLGAIAKLKQMKG